MKPLCLECPSLTSVGPGTASPLPGSPPSSAARLHVLCFWCSGPCPLQGLDRAPRAGPSALQCLRADPMAEGRWAKDTGEGQPQGRAPGPWVQPHWQRPLGEEAVAAVHVHSSPKDGSPPCLVVASWQDSGPLIHPACWNPTNASSGSPSGPGPAAASHCFLHSLIAAWSPVSPSGGGAQAWEQDDGHKRQNSRVTGCTRDSPGQKPGRVQSPSPHHHVRQGGPPA